jgi:putative redox protein
MAVEINLVYEGQLRCAATHGPSGATLATDAPVDNHGKGEGFSPTDLVATALGACVMTIMGIVAERHQIDLTGTRIHVTKEMIQQPIRRIGRLPVTVTIPADKAAQVAAADRVKLETAARHCPVHQSLHPDIDSPIEFVWRQPEESN